MLLKDNFLILNFFVFVTFWLFFQTEDIRDEMSEFFSAFEEDYESFQVSKSPFRKTKGPFI